MDSSIEKQSSLIRALRKASRINQVELANLMGLTQGTVSKIESGQLELSLLQVIKLAEGLNFSIQDFQYGEFLSYKVDSAKQKLMPKAYFKDGLIRINQFKDILDDNPKLLKDLKVDPDVFLFPNIKVGESFVAQLSKLFNFSASTYLNFSHGTERPNLELIALQIKGSGVYSMSNSKVDEKNHKMTLLRKTSFHNWNKDSLNIIDDIVISSALKNTAYKFEKNSVDENSLMVEFL